MKLKLIALVLTSIMAPSISMAQAYSTTQQQTYSATQQQNYNIAGQGTNSNLIGKQNYERSKICNENVTKTFTMDKELFTIKHRNSVDLFRNGDEYKRSMVHAKYDQLMKNYDAKADYQLRNLQIESQLNEQTIHVKYGQDPASLEKLLSKAHADFEAKQKQFKESISQEQQKINYQRNQELDTLAKAADEQMKQLDKAYVSYMEKLDQRINEAHKQCGNW